MRSLFWVYSTLAVLAISCSAKPNPQSSVDIVGGKTANISQYPFMVALAQKVGSDFEHLCGASQIEPGVILTAAHCVDIENMESTGYLAFNVQRLQDMEDPVF